MYHARFRLIYEFRTGTYLLVHPGRTQEAGAPAYRPRWRSVGLLLSGDLSTRMGGWCARPADRDEAGRADRPRATLRGHRQQSRSSPIRWHQRLPARRSPLSWARPLASSPASVLWVHWVRSSCSPLSDLPSPYHARFRLIYLVRASATDRSACASASWLSLRSACSA